MKQRTLISFFIFLFGSLISCNNAPATQSFNKAEAQTTQKGLKKIEESHHEKLTSLLYELALSQDPDDFAKKHNILLDNHRIRVYIILEPSASKPDSISMLQAHNIVIEKWSAEMVRGLVPVDRLIPLAEEPAVRFIRLPDKFIKTRKLHP